MKGKILARSIQMRTISLLIAISIPLLSPHQSRAEEKNDENSIQGCWELVAGSGFRKDQKCLKFIINGRETWIIYDQRTKKPKESAGGSYRLQGDKFTIQFEYATQPKYEHFLQKPFVYRYVRIGDTLRITEQRNGVTRLDQQWKLCK